MLDGAVYNAPEFDTGTKDGAENKNTLTQHDDEVEQLRHELKQVAMLCPDMTPQRIEQLVEEFRAKKESGNL